MNTVASTTCGLVTVIKDAAVDALQLQLDINYGCTTVSLVTLVVDIYRACMLQVVFRDCQKVDSWRIGNMPVARWQAPPNK